MRRVWAYPRGLLKINVLSIHRIGKEETEYGTFRGNFESRQHE